MVEKNLTLTDLPAEIAAFHDAIVEKVAALRLKTHQTMASIKKEREALAAKLQQDLARGESLRKADFEKLMGEVIEKRTEREKEVMEMLARFQQEERVVAQELKKLFREGRQVRLRDFKRFIAEASRATETRKQEIEEIAQASMATRKSAEETIARFRAKHEEMAKNWKALAVRKQKKPALKAKPASPREMPATSPLAADHKALPEGLKRTPQTSLGTKAKKQEEE